LSGAGNAVECWHGNGPDTQQLFYMLENDTLWEQAERTHDLLARQPIDHAMVDGLAVCLHGYRRNTVDLDLLVRSEDSAALHSTLQAEGYVWDAKAKEFHSASGVAIQFVHAGESEGPGQTATFPDPSDPEQVTKIEGLPVLTLGPLIQSKLVCGLGNSRLTHKDFADVVELIAVHHLDGSFARFLHNSVRRAFRQLVRRASGRK
jgi:hypothetical protein